jgi:hypothetical protein
MIRVGALARVPSLIFLLAILMSAPPALSQWSAAVNLGPSINTQYSELHLAISADELSLFFASDRPGGFGGDDLWLAQRSARNGNWEPATNLGSGFNTQFTEVGPFLSLDEHQLFFASDRPDGFGSNDFYMTTRQ